jgi:hypothetical protein
MLINSQGVDTSLESQMICVVQCETTPPFLYSQEVYRENKCIRNSGMLVNGLMYVF